MASASSCVTFEAAKHGSTSRGAWTDYALRGAHPKPPRCDRLRCRRPTDHTGPLSRLPHVTPFDSVIEAELVPSRTGYRAEIFHRGCDGGGLGRTGIRWWSARWITGWGVGSAS
jgi:hypothetical protein